MIDQNKPNFLPADKIKIGSWWRAADGGNYGCVVLAVNGVTNSATVVVTDGSTQNIDVFKLQYRYAHYLPNTPNKLIHPEQTNK
jgi:hypothetical protein